MAQGVYDPSHWSLWLLLLGLFFSTGDPAYCSPKPDNIFLKTTFSLSSSSFQERIEISQEAIWGLQLLLDNLAISSSARVEISPVLIPHLPPTKPASQSVLMIRSSSLVPLIPC